MSNHNYFKLEKDLCRCCHAEGSFLHLSEPVFNLGQREVYSEMLKESLDIEVSPMPGELSVMTFKICGACVLRLRDAHNFKQQVTLCEQRFKEMYKNMVIETLTTIGIKEELPGTYQEEVKKELDATDDDDGFDIRFDDSDDDQPVIRIKVEESKKTKAKSKGKPRLRKKKAPAKKTRSSDRTNPSAEESQAEGQGDEEKDQDKKGIWTDYRIVTNEDGQFFGCNQCEKLFTKRCLYSQHYKHVHKKLRPKTFRCRLCPATYTNATRARHMEIFHNIQAPKCNICEKKFAHQHLLILHQRIEHLGEKNYTCEICGSAFGTAKCLKKHKVSHFDVRPWECQVCGKKFKHKKNLKVHKDGHPKSIICPICDKGFCAPSEMKQHVYIDHPELC